MSIRESAGRLIPKLRVPCRRRKRQIISHTYNPSPSTTPLHGEFQKGVVKYVVLGMKVTDPLFNFCLDIAIVYPTEYQLSINIYQPALYSFHS